MKKYLKFTSLSSYTIANNCTDIDDCKVGIEELLEWERARKRNNLEIPKSYYTRHSNLKKN